MVIQNTNVGWLIMTNCLIYIYIYIYIYIFQGKYTIYGNKKHKDHKFLKYFKKETNWINMCRVPITKRDKANELFTYFGQPVVLVPMTDHTNSISGWKRNPITSLQNRMFCNRMLIERFQAGPCLLTGQGWHCWGVLSPAFVRWWDRHIF
jgi:hypothetical protein